MSRSGGAVGTGHSYPPAPRGGGGIGIALPPTAITLEVTPEMMMTLQRMSLDAGQPLDIVLTRAIGLYVGALRATSEGKHVGYAANADALEVEFTGIAGPGGV